MQNIAIKKGLSPGSKKNPLEAHGNIFEGYRIVDPEEETGKRSFAFGIPAAPDLSHKRWYYY